MNSFLRKTTGIFALTLMASSMAGCSTGLKTEEGGVQAPSQMEREEAGSEQPVSTPDSGKPKDTAFVDGILSQLPEGYLVSEWDYLESFGAEAKKAKRVEPESQCALQNSDPTVSPLCFTNLIILNTEKDTADLEEYIQNSDLKTYESKQGGELVQGMYQGKIPYVYTSKFFMCLGTGGDGCMRKQFVYHLEDGRNILVEMSYFPYEQGERVAEPIRKVQEVIDIYEKVLIQ